MILHPLLLKHTKTTVWSSINIDKLLQIDGLQVIFGPHAFLNLFFVPPPLIL